jgi:hypothetical protein
MSNKDIKTSYFELQEKLKDIKEIPDRLNRIDNVTKKELLLHIKERKYNFYKFKNEHFNIPGFKNYDFENNYSQVFTFNELQDLENLVIQSIEKTVKRNEFEKYFNSPGLQLFDYLNEEFIRVKAPTTKYTIIWFFLNDKRLITCFAVEYLKFVRVYCNPGVEYNRLAFDDPYHKILKKYEQELTQLYHDFLKLNTIE